jgi:hypothetical protein
MTPNVTANVVFVEQGLSGRSRESGSNGKYRVLRSRRKIFRKRIIQESVRLYYRIFRKDVLRNLNKLLGGGTTIRKKIIIVLQLDQILRFLQHEVLKVL